MAYKISWYEDKRIVSAVLEGEVTIDEIKIYAAELMTYLDDGIAPVHLIIDFSKVKKFPTNVVPLRSIFSWKHPKIGWAATVGGPALLQAFSSIVMQVITARYRAFKTTDQALEFLATKDETLVIKQ